MTKFCSNLKAGMTRDKFISEYGLPEIIKVSFESDQDLELFDNNCTCFAKEKHSSPSDYYLTYVFDDFEKLAINIQYLVEVRGWQEVDKLDNEYVPGLLRINRTPEYMERCESQLKGKSKEEIHNIKIYLRKYDTEVEFDYDIPAMLADKIREVVKEFYSNN